MEAMMSPNADSGRDTECVHDSYFCCSDTCEWPHCQVPKVAPNADYVGRYECDGCGWVWPFDTPPDWPNGNPYRHQCGQGTVVWVEPKRPNCMMGYPVRNQHNNCPYALICAVCDLDAEQQASHNDRSVTP